MYYPTPEYLTSPKHQPLFLSQQCHLQDQVFPASTHNYNEPPPLSMSKQHSTPQTNPLWQLNHSPPVQEDSNFLRPPPSRSNSQSRKQIESTVSINTGQKLQKLLDSGNAIYLGVDARDSGRSPTPSAPPPPPTPSRPSRILRTLLCGASLDSFAKLTLVFGVYLGGHTLLTGLGIFFDHRSHYEDYNNSVAILQVVFGFYLSAICLFGFSILWSAWRRSPTAALFFLLLWILTTFSIVVAAALIFFFFFAARAERFRECNAQTVKLSSKKHDPLRKQASQAKIDACVHDAMKRNMELMLQGVVHVIMAGFAGVVIVWAKEYRSRLLEIEELERLREELGVGGEKVGLLIGTAPTGMRSAQSLVSERFENERLDKEEEDGFRLGDRRRVTTLVRGGVATPVTPGVERGHSRNGSGASGSTIGRVL
ncbi:hypothetical protein FPQ18DRAFT_13629 [Pyronema domesticum]|uniref:Uncharacterized protein n=1 Tax=Pyronema omphalodes (strain CBS 100304) TaxID=1076935 RepID=U4L1B3_PYROM|nr:hypothetical protein FPQ18DRAFT_13629 [Pyronema domesticum]CCX08917.1 Protein of unknown function [Pyronema omphalodes CBS 100304]